MRGAVLLFAAELASADPSRLDPTRVHTFTLDSPRLASRSSGELLPLRPSIGWRVRVASSIAHLPAATPDGSVVIPHSKPSIAKYDATGRLRWTATLGTSPAAAPPIARADGTLLVLTEDGELIALSAQGTRLWSRHLPLGTISRSPVFGTEPGGLLIAEGRRITRVHEGQVTLFAELDQDPVAVLGAPGPAVAVGNAGRVWEITPNGAVQRRAELGGKVIDAVRLDETRLLALVDHARLVELDLERNTLNVRFHDPALRLGVFALSGESGVRILAAAGAPNAPPREILLALTGDGTEQSRSEIPPPLVRGDFALDAEGRVLLTHPGADALMMFPNGSSERIPGTACGEPFRPLALAGRGALLACRSGILVRVGEAAGENPVK